MTKPKIKRIRRGKYFLFKFKVHRFLPSKFFRFIGNLGEMSRWISEKNDVQFSDFPTSSFSYKKRHSLHEHVIDQEIKGGPIDYLEFGVARGTSFQWWVEKIRHPDSRFFGFDTFTGLPEDWGPFKKGDMSTDNEIPVIDDSRHSFYQGIFQETLPDFLKQYKGTNRKVIHLDADLYSSTLFVLASISPHLNTGDILLFDEFNVPMHEYKALRDWKESFYIPYSVVGR